MVEASPAAAAAATLIPRLVPCSVVLATDEAVSPGVQGLPQSHEHEYLVHLPQSQSPQSQAGSAKNSNALFGTSEEEICTLNLSIFFI